MLPHYATFLGVSEVVDFDGSLTCVLRARPDLTGRPEYLHGGAIAGLLELAAYSAIAHALDAPQRTEVKPIGITIEFMRNARLVDTVAAGRVLRAGARIANVTAEAWQDDSSRPIATARMLFSLRR